MRSLELQPTFENLKNAYLEDSIGRNQEINKFIELLDMLEDGTTICIDGKWGSGKTFFVRQTKMVLDAFNDFSGSLSDEDKDEIKRTWLKNSRNTKQEPNSQVTVYYDSWENDNDVDPILSIVYHIIKSIGVQCPKLDVIKFSTLVGTIVDTVTNRDIYRRLESLSPQNIISEIENQKDIHDLINEFLSSVIEERGNRLIIFIDELDRCKPSYAIQLLERIKHYFINDNLTFVFSVNLLELQKTIKKYYGNGFNACEYLNRFFDIPVVLNEINLNEYFSGLVGSRISGHAYDDVFDFMIKRFHFSIRETADYLRILRINSWNAGHSNAELIEDQAFCSVLIAPIQIGLYLHDRQLYDSFVNGDYCEIIIEAINSLSVRAQQYFYGLLLDSNESYDEQDSKIIVSKESKIQGLCNAIFKKNYSRSYYRTVIGSIEITDDTKMYLQSITGVLSNKSKYEND